MHPRDAQRLLTAADDAERASRDYLAANDRDDRVAAIQRFNDAATRVTALAGNLDLPNQAQAWGRCWRAKRAMEPRT